jgi:hypothetical protein
MGSNGIFYGFIAVALAVVTLVLWRNYRVWRAWKDEYRKQADTFRLPRAPLP